MIASLEDLSQTDSRSFVQIMTVDGNTFELPATPDLNISNFMGNVKARGYVGNENWFVVYDAIIWAVKVTYTGAASPTTGMTRQ